MSFGILPTADDVSNMLISFIVTGALVGAWKKKGPKMKRKWFKITWPEFPEMQPYLLRFGGLAGSFFVLLDLSQFLLPFLLHPVLVGLTTWPVETLGVDPRWWAAPRSARTSTAAGAWAAEKNPRKICLHFLMGKWDLDQSELRLRTEKSRVLNRETILRRLVHLKCSFIDMLLQLFHYDWLCWGINFTFNQNTGKGLICSFQI